MTRTDPRFTFDLPEGGALCAVSGGLDSMCLLDLAVQWGREQGRRVAAAHFNHQLRGEASDRDENFVRDWCDAHEIPFFAGRGDVRGLATREGLSTEEAARQLRYDFLEQTRQEAGLGCILTAHHADDNAETMLLNLIRGAGLRGLAGIPPRRGEIVRPLLNVTRAELEQYAETRGIPHVEDETNEDDEITRNLLRHKVLPVLRQANPKAVEHMTQAAAALRETEAGLAALAEGYEAQAEARPGQVRISVQVLEGAPPFLRPRIWLDLLERLGAGRKDVGAAHLAALAGLLTSDGDGQVSLPNGVTARRKDGTVFLERQAVRLPVELIPGQPVPWGDYTLTLRQERTGQGLALRPGNDQLTVVPCPAGERLCLPETNGGSRTVKRLCMDHGISPEERDGLPAIRAGERLAAVWPLGVDLEFAPEGEACRFIQIMKEAEEK